MQNKHVFLVLLPIDDRRRFMKICKYQSKLLLLLLSMEVGSFHGFCNENLKDRKILFYKLSLLSCGNKSKIKHTKLQRYSNRI